MILHLNNFSKSYAHEGPEFQAFMGFFYSETPGKNYWLNCNEKLKIMYKECLFWEGSYAIIFTIDLIWMRMYLSERRKKDE